jgi:hypothetical protein
MFEQQRRIQEEKGVGSIEEGKILPIPLKYFNASCLIYLYFDRANAESKKGGGIQGIQASTGKSLILEDTMRFEREVIPILRDMVHENTLDLLNPGLLSIVHAVQYKSMDVFIMLLLLLFLMLLFFFFFFINRLILMKFFFLFSP